MAAQEQILKQVQAALQHDAGINAPSHPLTLDLQDGRLTLSGEVASIAAKKRALEAVRRVPGVAEVVDRLRLAMPERLGDGAVRDAVCQLLLLDVDLRNCTIRAWVKGQLETLQDADGGEEPCGSITVGVEDGVVTLSGEMISLSHIRLAVAMAWWARGCRDVVNALTVNPPEADSDDEVTDALRLVLETDPRVHAGQIGIATKDYVVTLEGLVPSDEERRFAEQDAWCLPAVGGVVNHLRIGP